MLGRRIFIVFTFLFLLASIPFGVYLVKQQLSLQAQASNPSTTRIEIITAEPFKTTVPQVRIQLFYQPSPKSPAFPTSVRLSNSLAGLDVAPAIPFSRNGMEVDWQLDNTPGPKTVYGQFQVNGNWSSAYSATTVLDIPPTAARQTPIPTPAPPMNKYDLNQDGVVNNADVTIMLDKIRNNPTSGSESADYNGDGVINLQDYSELVKNVQ